MQLWLLLKFEYNLTIKPEMSSVSLNTRIASVILEKREGQALDYRTDKRHPATPPWSPSPPYTALPRSCPRFPNLTSLRTFAPPQYTLPRLLQGWPLMILPETSTPSALMRPSPSLLDLLTVVYTTNTGHSLFIYIVFLFTVCFHTCGSQEANLQEFSSSTAQILGIKIRLGSKCLSPLSHLTGTSVLVSLCFFERGLV